jgi:hypothetical protein
VCGKGKAGQQRHACMDVWIQSGDTEWAGVVGRAAHACMHVWRMGVRPCRLLT